mgnify:CR=1 FL=1|tara:strand:+ start:551 stop:1402 length:852 start_codon:yes stop_codon:yes gene_type:complete
MSISSSAVLVQLNISAWTANKLDRKQTEGVISRNHASGRAAKVHKNLMVGTVAAKELNDLAAQCRLFHNQWTLPFEDRGNRILPTSLFMDYKSQMNMRRKSFLDKVSNFKDSYHHHIQTTEHYLGDMFNPDDYPPVEEVMSKYAFNLTVKPMPEAGHFILDIPAHDLEEVKESLSADNDARLENAVGEAWHRMHKVLTDMSTKLTEVEGEDKRRWFDSFVSNPQELCKMLTHLNVTGDPKLEEARRILENTMFGADIDQIKESELVRHDMKTNVDKILEQFDW